MSPAQVLAKNVQVKSGIRSHRRGPVQRFDWIGGLHKLSQTIVSFPDRNSIVKTLLETAERVVSVHAITVRLRNHTTGLLDATACLNLDATEWTSTIPRGAVGLSRAVVESGTPVMIVDVQNHAGARHGMFLRKYGLVSYLGIPLVVGGEVNGVIGYYSKNPRGFRSDEIQYLITITNLAAISIQDAQLREKNAEQVTHLQSANVTAQKSEKAKSEFLGVMSHEFRTPLSLIIGYAGMMLEGIMGDLTDEQRNSLDRIMQCSDDLLSMVMSILEASTIEAGAARLENQDFDPKDLLAELKAALGVPGEKKIELIWNWPEELPHLKTDRAKLKQVLEHLIENALKFCDRGRVMISAELAQHASTVKFSIADTGVGIAPEALPFIFEKFRQCDSSITRSHGGVGLGLYIAKKFTDLLGGEISVTSEPGAGSTFNVLIPCAF